MFLCNNINWPSTGNCSTFVAGCTTTWRTWYYIWDGTKRDTQWSFHLQVNPSYESPRIAIRNRAKDSDSEQREWERSLDVFQRDQINFMKRTLKSKPGIIGSKGGTGKEMYWVGLVPYRPDYANRSRISDLLDIESDVKDDVLPKEDW